MIVVLSFIINLFAPIVNLLGMLGLCLAFTEGEDKILLSSAALAVVGLVYGIIAYRNDIPPRWAWSKSVNQLFSFAVTAVLGYAVNFAMWPCAIYVVMTILEKANLI